MSEWFLSSTVTVAAVLAIRWGAKDRVSYRLRYALWILVLVRLLIPMNFTRSCMSLERLLPPEPAAPGEMVFEVVMWHGGGTEAALAEVSSGNGWLLLWFAGAAAVLVFLMVSGIRFQRGLLRDRVLLENVCSPVPVYVTAEVEAPCQVGLFRPVIYVTDRAAGEEMLPHVLAHEMTHLRHFDHLWLLLRCVAFALHWFNPLVWLAVRCSKEDAELACDEGALAFLGQDERFAYGQTLIHLSNNRKGGIIVGANAMLGGKGVLRRRIEAIACGKRSRRSMAMLAAVLCILTAGCTFTDAPETTLAPQPSETVKTESAVPDFTEQLKKEEAAAQAHYDVWKEVTKDILTEQEEQLLNQIPGFDTGEEWTEGFRDNIKRNMYCWRSKYGADHAGIVSVEEIFDDRAEPGVQIYEIRCFMEQGSMRQERSDYIILSENTMAWTSDLDCCSISDVFNIDA